MQPKINKFCKCCGNFGHCITINGCDFAANCIKTSKYLEQFPNMVSKIFMRAYCISKQTSNSTKNKGNVAQKFVQTASCRDIKIGAKIRTLFDIIGETLGGQGFYVEPDKDPMDLSSDKDFQDSVTGDK